MTPLAAQLDALLARDADTRCAEAQAAFATASRGRPIVLMGAGGLGRRTVAGLRKDGIEPLAFADNSPARQGGQLEGLRVLSPADAAHEYGKRAAFVVTIWGAGSPHRMAHSVGQLSALGCDVVIPFTLLYWAHASTLLPHYLQDEPHHVLEQSGDVRRGFDLWADDASRAAYVANVRFRLDGDFDGLPHPVGHAQYFPDDIYEWRGDEWIADVGAYDGDSIRDLVRLHGDAFVHVLALEPDAANFARLQASVATFPDPIRARIECRQLAAAARPGTLRFDASGTAASAVTAGPMDPTGPGGMVEVEADTLDRLLHGARPTFIKLDIEGAEPDALDGARGTIEREAPVIAVCVYHRQDHMWRIPLSLKRWRDDYAFFLRPHNEEGWDLVCYAVPRARLTESAR